MGESYKIHMEQKLESLRKGFLTYENVETKVTQISECIAALRENLSHDEHVKEVKYLTGGILPQQIKLILFNDKSNEVSIYISEIKRAFSLIKHNVNNKQKDSEKSNERCKRCNFKGHKEENCKSKFKWDSEQGKKIALYTERSKNSSDILLEEIVLNNKLKLMGAIDTCANVSILCSKVAQSLNLSISEDNVEITTIDESPVNVKKILTPIIVTVKGKSYKDDNFYVTDFTKKNDYKIILGRNILSKMDGHYISLKENSILTQEKALENIKLELNQDNDKLQDKNVIEDSLTSIEKELKNKYKQCFEKDLRPKLMSGQQEFTFNNSTLKHFSFYQVPKNLQPAAQYILDYYEKNGMVKKEPNPEWVHPTMLIPKKLDESENKKLLTPVDQYRLVADLRMVNSQTVKQQGGNVNVITELRNIPGNKKLMFSMIDLKNAYQQIRIPSNLSPKFAFSIDGITNYSYTTLGQGALNSPYQFSLIISQLFDKEKKNNKVIQYMDDLLLVTSVDKNESDDKLIKNHRQDLEKVLKKLHDNHLRCNLAKSKLFRKKILFLAYELTQEGYRPCLKSIKKLIEQIPKDRKALTRFLFGVNYFRPVLNEFPKLSKRLFEKTSKKVPFNMDDDDIKNYKLIVQELLSQPTVGYPVDGWDYVLKTDASNTNLGICLTQTNPKNSRESVLIGLANVSLSKTLRARHSSYLELKSICCGLEIFDYLLKGASSVRIETDHQPLVHIVKNSHCHRYAELLSYLSSYPITICYVPAVKHSLPDFISRLVNYTIDTEEKKIFRNLKTDELYFVEPSNINKINELLNDKNVKEVKDIDFQNEEVNKFSTLLTMKKRGRPKKVNEQQVKNINQNQMRKRGRPRKTGRNLIKLGDNTSKRTRGRPKKTISTKENISLHEYYSNIFKNVNLEELREATKNDKNIMDALESPLKCYKNMPVYMNESELVVIDCGPDYNEPRIKNIDNMDHEIKYILSPKNSGTTNNMKIYIPDSYAEKIVSSVHLHGHFGYNKVKNDFKQLFYTDKLHKHVYKATSQCINCKLNNPSQIYSEFNRTVSLPDKPMQVLAMDIIMPKIHCDEFNFILAIVDLHSRYTWLLPLKDKDIHRITEMLFSEVFMVFGFPARLHCDNESIFRSSYLQKAMDDVGVEMSFGTPNYSKSNCFAENKIRMVNLLMSKLADTNMLWSNLLRITMFFMNTTKNGVMSPFEDMFLQSPRIGLGKLKTETLRYIDDTSAHNDLMTQACIIRDHIKFLDEDRRLKQNLKITPKVEKFKKNDLFIYKKPKFFKYDSRYTGPFVVDEVLKTKVKFVSSSGRILTASLAKIKKIQVSESERNKIIKEANERRKNFNVQESSGQTEQIDDLEDDNDQQIDENL
uniref:RNA-directed DNA polymerase n=1 Tax=Strongyloides papillosus TaxID=174720 RepID=A0A0N5CIJ3_STREA